MTTTATMRAKFKVTVVSDQRNNDGKFGEDVVLDAVYGADGTANAQWSKWTPSGHLTMHINNPNAWGLLPPGTEFYIDFTPA